jgi:ligand-binding sensor domain-containing protein
MRVSKNILFTAVHLFVMAFICGCNPDDEVVDAADLNHWTYLSTSDGLPSNNIFTLYEDKSERMWIGSDRGVSIYADGEFSNFSTADGLVANSVYAVLEDVNGDVWIGTQNGLNIFVDEEWFYFSDFYGVEINALLELPDNDVLIATGGYGVYRYDHQQKAITAFDVSNTCGACNRVLALYLDSQENVWVGSLAGAKRIKDNSAVTFSIFNGLSGNTVTDFVEDSFGNIWVGCFDGTRISRINDNVVDRINFSTGAPQSLSLTLEKDIFGDVWIGTGIFGLYKYDGAVMHQVYDGPPANTIRSMLTDKNGDLWVGTTNGIAQYVVGIN